MLIMLFLHVHCKMLLHLWSKWKLLLQTFPVKVAMLCITRDSILMIVIKPTVNSS